MNADITELLLIGVIAVAVAVAVMALLIRGDLGLAAPRRWLLMPALGLGVIAFTIKLSIISVMASFPNHTIDPLIERVDRHVSLESQADALFDGNHLPDRALWQSLLLPPPDPPDNPTTAAKVALGERLFHDKSLSRDGSVSCASCHDLAGGSGADQRATAVGITGIPGRRNSPTVWNAAYQARLFWDGRAFSLEEQALGPLVNPEEMGMPSLAEAEQRVAAETRYHAAFTAAFGTPEVSITRIAAAIAAFERTLVTADTPFDRFIQGDEAALSAAQQRGMWLFQKVGCLNCHSGPNFSGASLVGPRSPFAPFRVAGNAEAQRYDLDHDKGLGNGVWRVPSLRNIALTGPYFHNGAVSDLTQAVRIMAEIQCNTETGGPDRPQRAAVTWNPQSRRFENTAPHHLSDDDLADLVAFLNSLSSDSLVAKRGRQQGS